MGKAKKKTPVNKEKPKKIYHDEELYRFKVHTPLPLMSYLMAKLPFSSRTKIKSYLSHNQVLVDGMTVTKFDFPLAEEDVVTIIKHGRKPEKQSLSTLNIIYEDDDFIVINKPSGLLSIASDTEKEKTAYRLLNDYVRRKDSKQRIYILHRIDRDTSGVLVVAKNAKVRDALQKHWNDYVSYRGYYAIVVGKMAKKSDTFHTWLVENSTNLMYSSHRKGDGQEAITHYTVLATNQDYSLLQVNIDTGRKNQIRVHLRENGHPIVGDEKYGQKETPIGRLGLHAYQLTFKHPFSKKEMSFVAPMPKEFTSLFNLPTKKN